MTAPQPLATVIQGSLSRGLEARLNPGVSVEDLRVGKFVVIQGERHRFFGLLTDVTLATSNPQILVNPPRPEETLLQEVLAGTGTYGVIALTPMLMLVPRQTEAERLYPLIDPKRPDDCGSAPPAAEAMELLPVKTVPAHFSQVYEARELDFRTVFGWEDDPTRRNFAIGQPLDMAVPICLDLDRWVERSNGIFGKSGTGKSFLARLILAGIIRKRAAVNLVFDMHSEYGWEAASEDRQATTVKGLRQLFPGQVQIYTLDPDSTRRRGVRDARELFIAYNQIEVEDLALLAEELNLSEASLENAIILRNEFGRDWISRLLSLSNAEIQEFCEQKMGNKASILALQRKLTRLDDLKYIRNSLPHNYIGEILEALSRGIHVVIEFGSQSNLLSYMLAANVITRRIHQAYVQQTERYLQSKNPLDRPRQLCITIEEAHRFLDPRAAKQTIFGTIAREMRKYFVTLLVVDQRPSSLDREVMSQLGTRITALLNDDQDIEAVFTGVAGSQNLKTVLAKLDSKQQALVLGHAVPMPVVVQTRSYDQRFYAEIADPDWSQAEDAEVLWAAQKAKEELGL
ncbi:MULTISPECIES: ATP-binding protein [unclassified Synechococcus]|uniref:helicase HerA domain-containing protein n=1 Tax=unclassified Synechococcus TaxID=2626047 RepID=UPI000C1A04ED|nr:MULTISPECIES: ATP-binding protein [unclassified Synechococcus]